MAADNGPADDRAGGGGRPAQEHRGASRPHLRRDQVSLPAVDAGADAVLLGDLAIPEGAVGLILFAHGSGSSRLSDRNRWVAGELRNRRMATLLIDLLTSDEDRREAHTGHLRFDIELLTRRVLGVMDWLDEDEGTRGLALGLFGASTGAAAALGAAARRPGRVRAVVSRGGRPDLTTEPPGDVRAPTLLIVGARDEDVVHLNRRTAERLGAGDAGSSDARRSHELRLVEGATHLFGEPGALEEVAEHAATWFQRHVG